MLLGSRCILGVMHACMCVTGQNQNSTRCNMVRFTLLVLGAMDRSNPALLAKFVDQLLFY